MSQTIEYKCWFAASLAWNDYCDAVHRGESDTVITWYRNRYERVLEDQYRSIGEHRRLGATEHDGTIVLAPPRRVTSTAIAKVGGHGVFAFTITAISMLVAFAPMWALCVAAPLVIYIWWLVTGATIDAAFLLDEHPIPPARVLSEGPR